MKLSKEDKIFRLKAELIGVGAIALILIILALVKGVPLVGDITPSTESTSESTTPESVVDTSSPTGQASVSVDGVLIDQEEAGKEVEIMDIEETAKIDESKNLEIAKSDEVSNEIIEKFLNNTEFSDYFSPIYTKNQILAKDNNGNLYYEYKFVACDNTTTGKYSNLNMEVTYGVKDELPRLTYITLEVTPNMQIDSTARALISQSLSDMYGADLSAFSTMDTTIDFSKDGADYKATVASAKSYVSDYKIYYITVEKVGSTESNLFNDNKTSIAGKMDLTNITKLGEIRLDTESSIANIKNIVGIEETLVLDSANIIEDYKSITKEVKYKGKDMTMELKYVKNKETGIDGHMFKISDKNKTSDELKELAKVISNEMFNVVLTSMEFSHYEEGQVDYYSGSRISAKVFDKTLEVATAKSDLDFMDYMFDKAKEEFEPEIVVDESGEIRFVYPEFEVEKEPYGEEYRESLNKVENTEETTEESVEITENENTETVEATE